MSVAVVSMLKSEWYKMSPEERCAELKKRADDAMAEDETRRTSFTAPPKLQNTFPEWVRELIKDLCDEFNTKRKYDDLNNEYKIAVKDEDQEDFDLAWKKRLEKLLKEDGEKAKWHSETPLQLSFYNHGGDSIALGSDADLAELEQIQ